MHKHHWIIAAIVQSLLTRKACLYHDNEYLHWRCRRQLIPWGRLRMPTRVCQRMLATGVLHGSSTDLDTLQHHAMDIAEKALPVTA